MNKDSLDFGDYVEIEQKRHGVPNEYYRYKVIRSLRSNSYADTPVLWSSKEILHDEVVPVLACIRCGVIETVVMNFRLEDVKPMGSGYPQIEVIGNIYENPELLKESEGK